MTFHFLESQAPVVEVESSPPRRFTAAQKGKGKSKSKPAVKGKKGKKVGRRVKPIVVHEEDVIDLTTSNLEDTVVFTGKFDVSKLAQFPDSKYQRESDPAWVFKLAELFCTEGISDSYPVELTVESEEDIRILKDLQRGVVSYAEPTKEALAANRVQVLNGMHRIKAIGVARKLMKGKLAYLMEHQIEKDVTLLFPKYFQANVRLSKFVLKSYII